MTILNGRADCRFSSIHGGSLTSGIIILNKHVHESNEKNYKYLVCSGGPPSDSLSKNIGKMKKKYVSDSLLSDVEHDSLRTGIKSIMSQMDEMIAGMKRFDKNKKSM